MSRRVAFSLITLLALAMFARPLLRGEVPIFRDHSDYFQPLRYFTAMQLRNFRLPLWNPYSASGEPWLANPQTGVFYPPCWIFLFLPFATAYTLFLLLHVILLGCGAFLLFSRFASARGAFIGTVMLMLCGPTVSMFDISNNLTTVAWIPLILWCAMANMTATASGAAVAMAFLAGEPFFAAAGALMFAVIHRKNIIDAALTAFFLAGVELIPFLATVVGSDRAGSVPREEVLRDSMTLGDWLRMAVPAGMTHQQFIPLVYIGIVPSFLALVGIVMALRNRTARAWLLLLILCMVVAAGRFLPFIGAMLSKLPVTVIRYPARVVPLGALALIALAVIGWDRATRALPFFWLPVVALSLIVADLVPRIAPLLYSAPFNAHPVPYDASIGRDGKLLRIELPQRGFDRRYWISGYLNLYDRRFDAWTAAPLVSQSYTKAYTAALRRRDLLDAMSVAYILSAGSTGVEVHRNPAAWPMAYWRDGAGNRRRASSLAFPPNGVDVVIDAPADGQVIVTQQAASGWEVEVDGVRATPQREGVFRAVSVTRGHHVIAWRYRPRSLMLGGALTIIALARMLLSAEFVKRKWHKKNFRRESNFS